MKKNKPTRVTYRTKDSQATQSCCVFASQILVTSFGMFLCFDFQMTVKAYYEM